MSFNIPRQKSKRIVIGGGLTRANNLRKSAFQVVLIDKNNYHQFPPLISKAYIWRKTSAALHKEPP